MTCKDCIHWKACKDSAYDYYGEDAASAYDEDSCDKAFAETCKNFSDKSEWFHFPSKDCKTAYYALGHGSGARVLKEPIYGVAIKNGKCYIVDECDDLYEIGKTVFLTKEKAEKEVKRRKNR